MTFPASGGAPAARSDLAAPCYRYCQPSHRDRVRQHCCCRTRLRSRPVRLSTSEPFAFAGFDCRCLAPVPSAPTEVFVNVPSAGWRPPAGSEDSLQPVKEHQPSRGNLVRPGHVVNKGSRVFTRYMLQPVITATYTTFSFDKDPTLLTHHQTASTNPSNHGHSARSAVLFKSK